MLVLNATYEPINVCTVRRAAVLLLKDKAEIIEHAQLRAALRERDDPAPGRDPPRDVRQGPARHAPPQDHAPRRLRPRRLDVPVLRRAREPHRRPRHPALEGRNARRGRTSSPPARRATAARATRCRRRSACTRATRRACRTRRSSSTSPARRSRRRGGSGCPKRPERRRAAHGAAPTSPERSRSVARMPMIGVSAPARATSATHRSAAEADADQHDLPLPVLRPAARPAHAGHPRLLDAPDDLGRVPGRAARPLADLPRTRSLSARRATPARSTAATSSPTCASTTARSASTSGAARPTRRASPTPTPTAAGPRPRGARPAACSGPRSRPPPQPIGRRRTHEGRRTSDALRGQTDWTSNPRWTCVTSAGGTSPASGSGVARCGFAGRSQPPDLAAEHLQGPVRT